MSDDSSDGSGLDLRPSGSKNSNNKCRNRGADQKRKRRIVMRIEFDDSDEDSGSASDNSSVDGGGGNGDLDGQPSCSTSIAKRRSGSASKTRQQKNIEENAEDDSQEFQRNASRCFRNRGSASQLNGNSDDSASSGSEINQRVKPCSGRKKKNLILSEDECSEKQNNARDEEEAGTASDSSSNELLEKCPICLLTFRQQEIGTPGNCEHVFCANCIEAWSKNVQTCPIDRIEFDRIIVRDTYENRQIVREIFVDSEKCQKELMLSDDEFDDDGEEDLTCCEICKSSHAEDLMLLCDSCNQGYHIFCLSPPLSAIPEGSWYCDNCFDSEDEAADGNVEEDLNMLYEDIRDMGIPEASLRVTEVYQPRILRTRQNERIRAAVLRHTRSTVARTETSTTTTTTKRGRGRPRNASTTTTTTTMTRTTKPKRRVKRRRRRQTRKRTYVVEYDLNKFDEKFAIKTTKKIIRRRRRKRRQQSTAMRNSSLKSSLGRMTASKRLAEQMGVKRDPTYNSQFSGAGTSLSIFGGANDLEYFSDSDPGGFESEMQIDTGHGTAVQTSVRISSFGSHRSRKGLLLDRLQGNRRVLPIPTTTTNATPDVLSSIMDMQDRWHNATRNLENVRINADGSLNLPIGRPNTNPRPETETQSNVTNVESGNIPPPTEIQTNVSNVEDGKTQTEQTNNPSDVVTQAPMYPRSGGGNPNFNRGGVGGGNYNNRFNNQNNYSGGSGGGNQYRHSTGGAGGGGGGGGGGMGDSGGNFNSNMVGRGNFNFSNPNFNNNNPPQNPNFSPFSIRFNNRNQQNNNNNQRNSLPFMNRNDNNMQQQLQPMFNQHQQQQQRNQQIDNSLFSGLPPPIVSQPQMQPPSHLRPDENLLFGGLPPPANVLAQNQEGPISIAPPNAPLTMPTLMSIPPPPAPPPGVNMSGWNNSLFQLNSDYGNDEDDSNCPNFSVYSVESQEVAKSSERGNQSKNDGEAPKEDDENEDLVQLDDDDDIPMPPEPENSDLYEPENPTEEKEDATNSDDENNKDPSNVVESIATAQSKSKDDSCEKDDKNGDNYKGGDQYDSEHEQDSVSEMNRNDDSTTNIDGETLIADGKSNQGSNEINAEKREKAKTKNQRRSTSPLVLLPESEEASAANRKGVLELYDDSDWEELDIEKPKGFDKNVSSKDDKVDTPNKSVAGETQSEANNEVEEPDRSYTPCLDENNDPEDDGSTTPLEPGELPAIQDEANAKEESVKSSNNVEVDDASAEVTAGIETELISDDDADERRSRGKGKKLRSNKRDRGDKYDKEGSVQAFKKVSNKQKERNYRGEKQPYRRVDRRRSSRSRSKSRSLSRSRSRSRVPRGKRSRGRGKRSRSRSIRERSRSRSNNKENQYWRQGRFSGSQRNSRGRGGFQRYQQPQPQQRPKRRELPRYDVRNVISSQQRNAKDRYGRDTSRGRNSRSVSRGRGSGARARSFSRTHSRTPTPKRARRCSFSISPSPPPLFNRQHSVSPAPVRRFHSPRRRLASPVRRNSPPMRQHSRSPLRIRSQSLSPVHRMNGRKVIRQMRNRSPVPHIISRSRSLSASPRYTPRPRSLSSISRQKGKKKKSKDRRKKKSRKRVIDSFSTGANIRIARQPDPFLDEPKHPKKKRRHSPAKAKSPVEEGTWSPSPTPPPIQDYERDNNVSWTPPLLMSPPRGSGAPLNLYQPDTQRSGSKASKKDKRKRLKKKKKTEKRREVRKDKRRLRRTQTPESAPSKEVFASGNNILVSVSFNKEGANQQQQQLPQQQTTVVTLPPTRENILSGRRVSVERLTNNSMAKKKRDRMRKRRKIDTKPVAIIDLERSPFQVHLEPADIIVLTDSDEANEGEHILDRRERRRSESGTQDNDHHRPQISSSARSNSQHDKTPPMERLETILEESYDNSHLQTGPKTPPEPPIIKFNMPTKKQNKVRNPLHDEAEINAEIEMQERQDQERQEHRQELDTMHLQNGQKIGPNTPPESGPCSPDAYDPFEPTKSPSLSPRSPTPPPMDVSQISVSDSADGVTPQKHGPDEQRPAAADRDRAVGQQIPGIGNGGMSQQTSTLNPVELVMALMNSKANSSQDLANKSNESQFSSSSHILSSSGGSGAGTVGGVGTAHDDSMSLRDKTDETNGITVLSNLLLSSCNTQQSQHIPVISSPAPMIKINQIMKLPLPKVGGSVGSSSGIGMPSSSANIRNGGVVDDSFNLIDIDSPYSPGSADYEDLFEPPPDTNNAKKRKNRGGKAEVFDNLFGSSSPLGHLRLPSYTASGRRYKTQSRKSKLKGKGYDDLPNSAVELQVKDKFLRKLNRQERVVEEVKLVLKPRFNKKQITKDDYKEIMRRAVPKICHSRSGDINPHKIKNLIEAYVKKFRAKHKKLNIINTGQVSSAVKCAAYLKKL